MKIVRETLEFERGKSPKSSMGIGLKSQIEDYLEEVHNLDYLSAGSLDEILQDAQNLDRKTRESWVKFILQEGYDWDENELYEMIQQQIDVVGNLPVGEREIGDLKLIKTHEGWEIQFSGWEDFSEYFDDENYHKFLNDLLSGDAWNYFEYDGEHIDISDIAYFIENNDIDLSDLRNKFIEYGGREGLSDKEILETIQEDDDFEDLVQALKFAGSEATANAEESAAFNQVKRIIINHFELSNIEWDTSRETYDAHITPNGVEKLLQASYLGDEKPNYSEPYGGYMADWDKETFEMALENQLSNL